MEKISIPTKQNREIKQSKKALHIGEKAVQEQNSRPKIGGNLSHPCDPVVFIEKS
jgi:hypothetical protein